MVMPRSMQPAHGCFDPIARGAKQADVRRRGQAKVIRRSEQRPGNERDACSVEKIEREILIARDPPAIGTRAADESRTGREHVERPFGSAARKSRDAVEALLHQVTALLEACNAAGQ